MISGELREYVTFQKKTAGAPTALGEPTYTWSTFCNAYANVSARGGGEKFDDPKGERYSETVYQFLMRRDDVAGIDATMRISFDGQLYDIRDVRPDDNRREAVVVQATLQNVTLV